LRWAQGQAALSLSNPRFRDAVLNVAAPLRGIAKDELDGADVRQLRKNRRFVRALFAAIGAAAILAGWQWRAAVRERDVAERQARVAMSRKLVADSRLPEYSLDASLLLAAEGYQIAPTRDAHENLIRLAHDNDRFLQFLQTGEAPITALAVPPKRLRIVAGDKDGHVWMWSGTDKYPRVDYRRLDAEGMPGGAPIELLAVDGAGDRATGIDGKGRVTTFTLADDGIRRQAVEGCPAAESARVRLSAQGNRLAVRSEDGRATLWTITGARCSQAARLDGLVGQYFALSPSGNYFAVSERSGGATWWDMNGRTGRVVPSALRDGFLAYSLQFDNNDKRLAIADSYRVAVWDMETDRRGRQMLGTAIDSQFSTMAFSDDGNQLAIGMQDGTVDVWRFGRDAPVRERLRGHRYGFHVTQLAFNANGTMLASAAEDGVVMLWYFGYTGGDKPLARELRGHAYRVQLMTFHPFTWLVSTAGSGAIVWTAAVTGDLPFLSHLGRNESLSSSWFDPVKNITIALPGIVLRDVDKDGCRLVEEARAKAGRTLTAGELTAAVGDLQYSPTCPPPAR
jgi:WD40 repeat protein